MLCHRVTVQTRDDRGRLPGDIHENGRDRSAVGRAVIDARHHDDRSRQGHVVGDGQKHGHGAGRSKARKDAHEGSHEHPHETEQQVYGLVCDGKADEKIVKNFHLVLPPEIPQAKIPKTL